MTGNTYTFTEITHLPTGRKCKGEEAVKVFWQEPKKIENSHPLVKVFKSILP